MLIRAIGISAVMFSWLGGAFAAEPVAIESLRARSLSLNAPVAAASDAAPVPASPAAPADPASVGDRSFNAYVMKAVNWLYDNYGLLGYDIHSILTHNIAYNTYGDIVARNPPLTMCVAAQMEVILTAYRIYAEETGDYSVYDYLPKTSFEKLGVTDLKGHIWVNHDFNAWGTADALINFGMGESVPFESLKPGSFVNINRDNATGHAVTFINYIDINGNPQAEYNPSVAGFRYFSSNGGGAGQGGLGYGNAIFRQYGCPSIPGRDCGVIYSADQHLLNTGSMLMPKFWNHAAVDALTPLAGRLGDTVLDENFFTGVAPDRVNPAY